MRPGRPPPLQRPSQVALLLGFAAVPFSACAGSQPSVAPVPTARTSSEIPLEIRLELVQMGGVDQEVRQGITATSLQDTALMRRIARADSSHTERLRQIIDVYGWPDPNRVGADAAQAAFLILQHSPAPEFQKDMLPVLEAAGMRGELPLQEVALLTDRVLMHDGLAQRYGSQVSVEGGRLVLHPIEDELQVDTRRSTMGLPPLDEYLDLMEEMYGMPVIRQP